jgi:hypothetical protein
MWKPRSTTSSSEVFQQRRSSQAASSRSSSGLRRSVSRGLPAVPNRLRRSVEVRELALPLPRERPLHPQAKKDAA